MMKGKVVLITGGSAGIGRAGIGRAAAGLFADVKAKVIIAREDPNADGRRNRKLGQPVVSVFSSRLTFPGLNKCVH